MAEGSQNNENIDDSRCFIVLQTRLTLSEQMSDQNSFFIGRNFTFVGLRLTLKDNHEFYQNTITVANILFTLPL